MLSAIELWTGGALESAFLKLRMAACLSEATVASLRRGLAFSDHQRLIRAHALWRAKSEARVCRLGKMRRVIALVTNGLLARVTRGWARVLEIRADRERLAMQCLMRMLHRLVGLAWAMWLDAVDDGRELRRAVTAMYGRCKNKEATAALVEWKAAWRDAVFASHLQAVVGTHVHKLAAQCVAGRLQLWARVARLGTVARLALGRHGRKEVYHAFAALRLAAAASAFTVSGRSSSTSAAAATRVASFVAAVNILNLDRVGPDLGVI